MALTDHRVAVGLICDLEHVAAATIGMVFAAAPGRVCVVSDLMATSGDGARFGSAPVHEVGGSVRSGDGTLAGSAVGLDQALRNLLSIGIDQAAAIAAVSTTPAAGLLDSSHDLAVGSPGLATIVDDSWSVIGTVTG